MITINYLGLKCGVCGKDFKEDDDVVVCPDCGTPSHKACYKDNKGCPNADKHGEKFVFEDFDKIKKSAQGIKEEKPKVDNSDEADKIDQTDIIQNFNSKNYASHVSVRREIPCPNCGEMNKSEANYCNRCGAKFVKIQSVPVMSTDGNINTNGQPNVFNVPTPPQIVPYSLDPIAEVTADTEFEDNVTAADLSKFVSVNTPYYMRVFDQHKRKKKKINLAACLFSGIWFLYRKLYKIGSLIFSMELLLYSLRFYIQQRYGMDIMNRLITSIGLDPEKSTSFSFQQYMQMSDALMKLSTEDQLMFMIPSILFFVQIAIMIVCGVIANKLYYNHCIKRIQSIKKTAKEESFNEDQITQALYLGGGVNPFVAGAFGLLYFILFR